MKPIKRIAALVFKGVSFLLYGLVSVVACVFSFVSTREQENDENELGYHYNQATGDVDPIRHPGDVYSDSPTRRG